VILINWKIFDSCRWDHLNSQIDVFLHVMYALPKFNLVSGRVVFSIFILAKRYVIMKTDAMTSSTLSDQLKAVFEKQKENQFKVAQTSVRDRRKKLSMLLETVQKYKPEIRDALYRDFRKHPSEVDLSEIFPITSETKFTRSRLKTWMRPEPIRTPLTLLGTKSWVRYEPKGVVLIISPWNFPVNLTFGPLISAIAAGNCVILKPSEYTEHTSLVMEKMIRELFDPSEVCLIGGGVEVAKGLLELPFDHIFFTGSPAVGKKVMAKAAKHLTSVTLELGGKSPTIIDQTANLKKAAKRISWGKFINNGQVCLAPDYLLVHEDIKEACINHIRDSIEELYGPTPENSADYARMVNKHHYQRVKGLIKEAEQNGEGPAIGGQTRDDQNYIAPTVIEVQALDSGIMMEEIFGPVLPVITFRHLHEAVKIIQEKEKPLALYIYSRNKKNINYILDHTRAGGTCINHNVIHYFNHHLPFGGTQNSGMGKSHGKFGFKAFSNARAILKQTFTFSTISLMMPPYTNFKQKIIDLSIRWF
jgi:aldehyde dehydrogenase (NAD+)